MPYERLKETPSQTAGPFLHIGMMPNVAGHDQGPASLVRPIAGDGVPGERITIEGTVIDGTGSPCRDALIEFWQADANGIYAHGEDARSGEVHENFIGFGRAPTDFDSGQFRIETIKPGAVPGRHGRPQAPHISLWIVARGINIGLHTRLYFADEDNSADPLLAMIEQAPRRDTLIAQPLGEGCYRFDIRLQGEGETVFLDI